MKILEDIQYGAASQQQVLDVYLPDSDRFSVLIYFHGGRSARRR